MQYAYTKDAPDRMLRPEVLRLADFYDDSRTVCVVSSVVTRITATAHAAGLSNSAAEVLRTVSAACV